MVLHINERIRLESIAEKHGHALFEAIHQNRAHLAEFLPWVGHMKTLENVLAYIWHCEQLHAQGKEVSLVVLEEEKVIGRIGLHDISPQNRNAAIGYWLTQPATGKGIITAACKGLISYAFKELRLHRLEIKAAVKNIKSQAIPEKLNFTREGVLRQAELVNKEYLDLVLYSLLSPEWKEE